MEVHIKRLTETHLDALLRLSQSEGSASTSLELLKQKYECEVSELSYLGYIAYDAQQKPIAHCGALLQQLNEDGLSIRGAQFVDIICTEDWADKGLLPRLLRRLEILCLSYDMPLHFALEEEPSDSPLIHTLGWTDLSKRGPLKIIARSFHPNIPTEKLALIINKVAPSKDRPKPALKHILLLTPGFAADENDSRCIPPLQLFVQQLQEQGIAKISLISLHYPFSKVATHWRGIPVYSCYSKGLFSRLRISWQAYRWMRHINKEDKIDGIHSFWLSDAAWLGQWFSSRLKVPHWVTLMGQDVRPSNKYLSLVPPQKVFTIALSDFHNEQLFLTSKCRANAVIPWGLAETDCPKPKVEKEIDILGVGNLIELKDYALFIELVASIREQQPKLRAMIIGDGPQRQALEAQAKEASLEDCLKFTGYLPREEVLQQMSRSRVLLHTSTFESFGYIYLEALACGMSVVSRPVGIAKASSRWRLGEDKVALQKELTEALAESDLLPPSIPYPIQETIETYQRLYYSDVNNS